MCFIQTSSFRGLFKFARSIGINHIRNEQDRADNKSPQCTFDPPQKHGTGNH